MRIVLARPHPSRADGSYEGHAGTFRVGEARSVSDPLARELLIEFSDFFEIIMDEVGTVFADQVVVGPDAPPRTGALQPAPRRRMRG